ncbi:hypothetical protein ACWF9X_16210 [Streptomyces globisporus]
MKKLALSTALAASLLLSLTSAAQSAEPAVVPADPAVQEHHGQGAGACPRMSLCLYQDFNLNAENPGKIWVFPVTEDRIDVSLKGHPAANQPSSGYMNAPSSGWAAYLFPDYICGFGGDGGETIQFFGGRRLDSLDGVNGRAKRYGYFYKNGKWTTEKKWGITERTLYLHDRAGCVTTGPFNSTDDLRPPIDGDM